MNLRNDYASKVPGFQGSKGMTHEDFKKMKESFIDKISKNSEQFGTDSNFFGARKQSRTQGGNRPVQKLQVELGQPLSQNRIVQQPESNPLNEQF
jgi:hypothetical protein